MNWIAIVVAAWSLGAEGKKPEPAVRIQDARVETQVEQGETRSKLVAVVINELDEAIQGVDLGVIMSPVGTQLSPEELVRIYGGESQARVYQHRLLVDAEISGKARVLISEPLELPEDPDLQLSAHLLGYRLSTVSELTLLRLLESRVAADEMAVVESLGLRWKGTRWLRDKEPSVSMRVALSWLDKLDADWPLKPSLRDLKQLCVAALAASLDGSEVNRERLRGLSRRRGIAWFDEPLQLLRTARLTSTPLQSPLAFVVPDGPTTMAGLLKAMGEPDFRFEEGLVRQEHTAVPVVTQPKRAAPMAAWIGWLVLVLGLLALFCYRHVRRRENGG
ncbi:MAG: hypothetical protein VX834_04245 [Myxococcota bacterium]|nr:hypothetical protein [Myxococcota bacterium]